MGYTGAQENETQHHLYYETDFKPAQLAFDL
jgi:hypothetical protein